MKWLIRRVLKKGKGAVSYEEDTHFGDVLTIGRAADQAIFLPDLRAALNHARVTLLPSGEYKIESLILAGIRVNGEIIYTTTAPSDTTIEIGNTRLVLLPPPADYDGGVEVATLDKGEQKAEKDKRAKPTRLAQTGLRKRMPSWILFIGVLLIGLALPMIGHFRPGFGELLRHTPLPSTQSWNPGTIDAAHHFFSEDCTKCHQTAFRTVRDNACLACHANTAAHADAVKFNLPELGNAECRACHQDHQGLRGLVRQDQRLCADCHGDLKARSKNASSFDDVRDFGRAHPEFKINLPAWDANGKFAPQRVTLAANLKENSGLKFNHLQHLKADGLSAPKGRRTLDCASCHIPEPGGAKMRPVNFEAMCHDCHTLGFDTLAPEREVPHGKVSEVIYMLGEYYAKFALEGGYLDAKSPLIVQERRRPGSPPLSQQEKAEALAWAREQTARVTNNLFAGGNSNQATAANSGQSVADKTGCPLCHKVTAPSEASPTWKVAPVRVSGVWYADAKFTHAKHVTVKCEDCHAARDSKESADVLIPGISNCRACHGGAYAKDKVATTCIACHNYHLSATLKLGKP
jgi:pSer/pThr/pTyr-binding forkhead associated (FHA) protein